MKIKFFLIIWIIPFNVWPISNNFKETWYDGKAEISTYAISEMRYGEYRKGTRVMVFVTEPLRLSTRIKPDQDLPSSEKIEVIKLNDIRKFNTGIYDYSVMTSVFSSVEPKKGIPLSSTIKISFTSQEWCGNVFEILERKEKSFKGKLFSYFESEGNTEYDIKLTERLETEDNIWLKIRELNGLAYEPNKTYDINLIPSAWSRRKTHKKPMIIAGSLKKELAGTLVTEIGPFESNVFTWEYSGKNTKVWVEANYPRRILKWKERDGSFGLILASSRETYWNQNKNRDLALRQKLRISEILP